MQSTETEKLADTFSPIEKMYRSFPQWREMLSAIEAGKTEFAEFLREEHLHGTGLATSAVHASEDMDVHAFVLAIVSSDRWEEVQTKSFLTYASHWIDDFFDSPDRVNDPDRLLRDRHDIRVALTNMGPVGRVGFAMAERVRHSPAVYKALQRMLYGGLVQRCHEASLRHELVREYLDVATQGVNRLLVGQIRRLRPEAYWTTNKTVLEMLSAAESDVDYTISELWNLIYAPALYYQDLDEERDRGEFSFTEEEEPGLGDMVRMIRLGSSLLARRYLPGSPQMLQLEFLTNAFSNLPVEVASEYRALWEGRKLAHQSCFEHNSDLHQTQ